MTNTRIDYAKRDAQRDWDEAERRRPTQTRAVLHGDPVLDRTAREIARDIRSIDFGADLRRRVTVDRLARTHADQARVGRFFDGSVGNSRIRAMRKLAALLVAAGVFIPGVAWLSERDHGQKILKPSTNPSVKDVRTTPAQRLRSAIEAGKLHGLIASVDPEPSVATVDGKIVGEILGYRAPNGRRGAKVAVEGADGKVNVFDFHDKAADSVIRNGDFSDFERPIGDSKTISRTCENYPTTKGTVRVDQSGNRSLVAHRVAGQAPVLDLC